MGLAFGDALGAPTEFLDVIQIRKSWPPDGPKEPPGNPMRVTDDTQMALAVGEALVEAGTPFTLASLEHALRKYFVEWLVSPENNRAPGMTCLSACENLAAGMPWHKATRSGSKGCGANMRVAPVGLLHTLPTDTRAAISQFQAALTHGHPTALAASDLTAFAVTDLLNGGEPATLVTRLSAYAESQRCIYHEEWLGPLWEQPAIDSPEEFISRGWDECLMVLRRLELAVTLPDRESDPCLATGAGWIAEEAFATGCLCFLLFPEHPVKAIQRAALTSGDSDSIACLAGAFAGAYMGIGAWSKEWIEKIEYRDRLINLASGLATLQS